VLGLFLAFQPKPAGARYSEGDRVLTGELVMNKGTARQFHLVGHSGSFTAPSGMDIEAWDGKPVEVEFGGDGRVVQISPMHIEYAPIEHSFVTVSGQLVAQDPVNGTFGIAGDRRTYVAPPGIDIQAYAGRVVEIRLDEHGQVTEINPLTRAADAPLPRSGYACFYGDASFATGASICRRGTVLRCSDGAWVNQGAACGY
jgi:hypothetical protein